MKINWKSNQKKYKRVEGIGLRTWDSTKFAKSPVSKKLIRYFSKKFLESVAIIALLKCLALVSCELDRPRVSVVHVAPSRHFKTYTSNEVRKIFDKEFWLNTQSDFTIHSLERYKKKIKQNICIIINDATTLFASKAKRAKDRLVGGLSELLADGVYIYQDFNRKFILKGQITLILNITSESYKNYKDRMLGLTFSERVLTLYHVLTKPEMNAWVAKQEKTKRMHFKDTITLDTIETNIKRFSKTQLRAIKQLAKEFSYLSVKGFIGCQDIIKAILRAHASLNNRQEVCDDDFKFLSLIKDFLTNPYCPYDGEIVKYAAQGLSYREICRKIGKPNHINYVYSLVQKARIRGILPPEPKSDHDTKKGKGPDNPKENGKGAD